MNATKQSDLTDRREVNNVITPFLWFNGNVGQAMEFYTSIFKNGKVISEQRFGDQVMGATFELNGQRFMALNGGPMYQFTPAISLYINCETQEEVDYYWDKLLQGGKESRCGWLVDQFGLSWQVIPSALGRLMGDPNREKANAVMQAMLGMNKLVIADLQAAYDNN